MGKLVFMDNDAHGGCWLGADGSVESFYYDNFSCGGTPLIAANPAALHPEVVHVVVGLADDMDGVMAEVICGTGRGWWLHLDDIATQAQAEAWATNYNWDMKTIVDTWCCPGRNCDKCALPEDIVQVLPTRPCNV